MGSGASIDERFPEDIRKSYAQTEEIKEQIALHDARFLKIQSSQAWKDHKKIIAALTERTKLQLQRVARLYSKIEADEGRGNKISAEMEIRNMLGGSYGDFMRLLVVSVDGINSELLDTALKCIGCDENLIADVLCAIPSYELNSAQIFYNSSHQENLQNIIKSKTLENSSFQKFILMILSVVRNTEKNLTKEEITKYCEELYQAGFGGHELSTDGIHKQKDDQIIFTILTKLSREQSRLVAQEFEEKYHQTFQDALSSIYSGSCLRALTLWTSSLLSAISSLFYFSLHSTVIDYDQTCHLATKYEKHILQQVIQSYEELYSENLLEKLSKSLTGNFKKSVIAWFTNPTYDDGFESKITMLVESCDGSIDNLLSNPEKVKELTNLVIDEHNSASSHLDETIAALSNEKKPITKPLVTPSPPPPPDPPLSLSDQDVAPVCSSLPVIDTEPIVSSSQSILLNKDIPPAAEAIINKPSKRNQMGYEEKFKLICDYLLTRFQQDDIDDSGMLNSQEFWNTLRSLNVGYTEDELFGIQAWVDGDGDGEISYAEVVNELADSLIDIIESNGQTVEDKVNELWEQNRLELARLWDEYQNWAEQQDVGAVQENMSPSLTQYLKDSFEAFDVDRNGTLDSNEFWNILVTLLGLSEGDRAMMEVSVAIVT
jgi:Ca2+-binding EF-hand superfamily protein